MEKVERLIEYGKDLMNSPREHHQFTKDPEADTLLNKIEEFPHLFVLGGVVDRQIKAERAWMIPYKFSKIIGGANFENFSSLSKEDVSKIFVENKLHRFNKDMAKYFYEAVQRIKNEYNGDASKIWEGEPSSAKVVRRFLEFEGVGLKIATMATNILAREFKIRLSDYSAIDISTDTHIIRMFKKLGLAPKNAGKDYIVYKAKEIYPEYPGILDVALFKMGKEKLEEI